MKNNPVPPHQKVTGSNPAGSNPIPAAGNYLPSKDSNPTPTAGKNDLSPASSNNVTAPAFPLWHHLIYKRYRIDEVIGHGAFGITYKGYDTVMNRIIAIKEYFPHDCASRSNDGIEIVPLDSEAALQYKKGLSRFVEEAQRLAAFRAEPGIVQVFDCIEDYGTAYLIMEFLEGILLEDLLKKTPYLEEEEAIDLLMGVMESLSVVHQKGIIHCNICPENIFITNDGLVKLIDFGASRDTSVSNTRSLSATVKHGYSPEEQYRGLEEQGPYTDVYSLAATLYRMLTGQAPIDVMTRLLAIESGKKDPLKKPRELNPMITPMVENALLNALTIAIEDRTKTVQDFINALSERRPVVLRKNKTTSNKNRIPRWFLAVVFAVLSVFVLVGVALSAGWIRFVDGKPSIVSFNRISVPNVIGLTQEEAISKLKEAGLTPVAAGNVASNYIEKGRIVMQSPEAGKWVLNSSEGSADSGSEVYLTISSGSDTIPYVVWDTKEEAIQKLLRAGYIDASLSQLELDYIFDDTFPAGLVLAQSVADHDLTDGEKLVLTISSGPSYGVENTVSQYYLFYPDTTDLTEELTSLPLQYRLLDGKSGLLLSNTSANEYKQYLVNYETHEVFPYSPQGSEYSISDILPRSGWYFWFFLKNGKPASYFEAPVWVEINEEASSASGIVPSTEDSLQLVRLYQEGLLIPNGSTRAFADLFTQFVKAYSQVSRTTANDFETNAFQYTIHAYGLEINYGSPNADRSSRSVYFLKLLTETDIQMFLIHFETYEIVAACKGVDGIFQSVLPGKYYCFPVFSEDSGLSYNELSSGFYYDFVVEIKEDTSSEEMSAQVEMSSQENDMTSQEENSFPETMPLFPCLLFFQDDYLSSPFQVKVENQESALAGLLLTDLEGSAPIPLMLDENGYICRKTDSGVEFAYLRVPMGYTLELVVVDEEDHILYSYMPAFTPPTDGETVIVTKD